MSGRTLLRQPPALRYLLPTAPSFWRWSADGGCVEWADGKTIAFRAELLAVLAQLAPGGLPPLDAVLLVLAATKPQWDGVARAAFLAQHCAADSSAPTVVDRVVSRRVHGDARAAMERLQGVADLPAALRQSTTAKASLAAFIFAGQSPYFPGAAEDVLHTLDGKPDAETLRGASDEDVTQRLADAFEALDRGLDRVDGDAVALWQTTGIAFELAAADVSVPPPQQTRALLAALQTDEDLGGVARVAADVLAAVHVPRALRRSDDLPLGGVSDVSNKGNLDQLLLSELASDDLTLSVRVAMGEALYLRREAPARHPPVGRWIVLDSGIRLWGTARLFAAAVGLALAAGGDPRGTLRVFRANGSGLDRVDLGTRAGLADHLGRLLASPDPRPAVVSAARLIAADTPPDQQAELILVTHANTAGPELIAALSALAGDRRTVRLATVTAAGAFAFAQVGAGGRTEIGRARLSLERLTTQRTNAGASAAGVGETLGDPSLPTILRLRSFPLALPTPVVEHHAAYTPATGLVGLSRDRRLLQWTGPNVGARQLSDRLPGGTVRAVLADAQGLSVTVAIAQPLRHVSLHTLALTSEQTYVHTVTAGRLLHVTQHGGVILVITDRQVHAVTPTEAVTRVMDVGSHLRWTSGRFFRDTDGRLFAATGTGFVGVGRAARAGFFFDHDTLGPVRMRSAALLEVIGSDTRFEFPAVADAVVQPASEIASPDGRRVIAWDTKSQHWLCLDLDAAKSGRVRSREVAHAFRVGPPITWSNARGSPMMSKLHAIARGRDGGLVLRSRKQPRRIALGSSGTLALTFDPSARVADVDAEQAFAIVPRGVTAGRMHLRKATWADGSAAWLDARGLLHLVSSDATLPQITFTLHADTRRAAGWLSTGDYFGPPFYTLGHASMDETAVDKLIRRFAARLPARDL